MKYNITEIEECILNRRTIRPDQFSSRKVHKEIVERLLNTARFAPSHGMTQPWDFKVFFNGAIDRLFDKHVELYKMITPEGEVKQEKIDKISKRKEQCSVAIAICMKRDTTGKIPEIEEIESVACAVQNIHLMATAYGIGGFWSSPKFVYTDEMKEFLGLGEEDKCLGFFYLGYPEGEWPKAGHRKPLEYKTEWIDE